jgi:2,5-diamino-6-(ribosylamino)-4(3H)-pyrimidinone 5'-phosphate reductase
MDRPIVFINCAMSADGKISSRDRRQVRISGRADLARVDALRAESDAVMVGVGTVRADDPRLRVKSEGLRMERRAAGRPDNPLRIVADSRARTPLVARVLGPGCIIAVSESAPQERLEMLSRRSEVLICGRKRVDLKELLSRLRLRGVRKLMVEGGASLNWSLIKEGLVDEIYVYIGAQIIGGAEAPTLADGEGFAAGFPRLDLKDVERLDDGLLVRWSVARQNLRTSPPEQGSASFSPPYLPRFPAEND